MLAMRTCVIALSVVLIAGCAPSAAPSSAPDAAAPPSPIRTLRVGTRVEPPSVATKPLRPTGSRIEIPTRAFNAELTIYDAAGVAQPLLAEALPQLNTDSWRVFPDGKMETTFHLRPGLTYHDGTALASDDFVFASRVYSSPDLGLATALPQSIIEEVRAPDPRTVIVRWTKPFPDAATLDLPPLPRHILAAAFERGDPAAFAANGYWSREYVGLGPFRLTQWEPGSFLEGEAFSGFVFGRPKIDRINVRFIGDSNAALAALLADDVQILADFAVTLEQLRVLKGDWLPQGKGQYILQADSFRQAMFQQRPDLVAPKSLLDVRVRKAIAYAFDRQAMNEAIYDGDGVLSDSPLPPNHQYIKAVDPVTVKYRYDLRQSERLMGEAGYTRGPDGAFTHQTEGRFNLELRTNASTQNETELHVLADGWKKAGFAITEAVTPTALVPDNEFRATQSGLYIFGGGGGDAALRGYNIASIPRPENRWSGGNRGGWVSEEYSRLIPTYDSTLDQADRARIAGELVRIYSDQLPSIPMAFNPAVTVYRSALRGPGPVSFVTQMPWNLYEWQLA